MKTGFQKLIFSLTWLALPMLTQAQFTFTTNNGAITITGYTGSGGTVVIPAATNGYPVTTIGVAAFEEAALISLTIPDGVTSIEDAGLLGCSSLTRVALSGSVTNLGEEVFLGCSSLKGVAIPDGVTSIGSGEFDGCLDLTNVTIPDSVTNIGSAAFYDCFSLTNIAIPHSVTSIGTQAFYDCTSLTSVTVPNSVTNISGSAFDKCAKLTSVYFSGNAPSPTNDTSVFTGDGFGMTAYYLLGAKNWGAKFDGIPAVLWNPQAITPDLTGGQFGFNLTGPTNATIVVQACTNLSNPVWLPIATNTFSASGTSTFTDPSAQPSRFYRFSSP